eukprot:TRINITY_DN27991_c0_g1_i1.p1 TRINITY_DN27991_c0_g1~~TRINITY_DN27991_c0_g1_i1.p1  ORF type:complete len:180 (+),score=78.11 TRINITY_DN27991_c0_g1_i1:98-637(+)
MNRAEVLEVAARQRAGPEEADDEAIAAENTSVGGRALTEVELNTQYTSYDFFEILKVVRDPEHPDYSLQDLGVIRHRGITVAYRDAQFRYADATVTFTPTVPHCHLSPHIALCCHERLGRYLPLETKWKLTILLAPGSHKEEAALNKQINDKERVCAAMQNPALLKEIMKCTGDEVCQL